MKSNKKKWIGYTLYGILLTFGLLYYRFPADAFKEYLQTTIHRIDPRLSLSIKRLSLSLPPGLKLTDAELSYEESPGKVFLKTEILSFGPKIRSYFKKDLEYCFESIAYDGNLTGCINFTKKDFGGPFSASIVLKDIGIDDNSPLPVIIGDSLEGLLSGTITYSGEGKSLTDGTGDAVLTLSEGLIKLSRPFLGLKAIDFKEVLLKMALNKKRLNLSHGELKGKDMLVTASGTIYINKEFLKSRLNLKGTIQPFADLFKNVPNASDTIKFFKQRIKSGKISFNIQGTIKDPRFKII
ncbi:type II secretion system protein GspN [Thermodesulfobacteriota bacterium]